MPKPVYQIVTQTGAVTDYTITSGAKSIYFKDQLTTGTGMFTFGLPTKTPSNYRYNDIAIMDTVNIYVGWDTIPANPNFVGRITKIGAPANTEQGYMREISGLSLSEILLRRQKTNKFYNAVDAYTIVDDVIDDLSSDSSYALAHDHTQRDSAGSGAYHVTLEIRNMSYYDIMRYVSDYWTSAGNEIHKDFYVDTSNRLVWKERPIRTTGVETFTIGQNIKSYTVVRDSDLIKNNITVYGTPQRSYPANQDTLTEDDAINWHATDDCVGLLDVLAPSTVGAKSIEAQILINNQTLGFHRHIPKTLNIRDLEFVQFWFYDPTIDVGLIDHRDFYLYAPDVANSFQLHTDMSASAGWTRRRYDIGPDQEYDVDINPNGIWDKNGTPNWWDIQAVAWRVHWSAGLSAGATCNVDGLFFYPERFSHTETNAASVASYGQRDYEVTDDKLHSDSDCEQRAEALEANTKDPVIEVGMMVKGNNNVLIGDQVHVTIPAEGLSAADFDVYSVEQHFVKGWFTTFKALNATASPSPQREPIRSDLTSMVADVRKEVKRLSILEQRH